jgi:hypothetical protein
MSIVSCVLTFLALSTLSLQGNDDAQIAKVSAEFVLSRKSVEVQRNSKIEVQVDGTFDRALSNLVGTLLGIKSAWESEAVRCTDRDGDRSCRLVDADLFLKLNQPTRRAGNRAEVSLTATQTIGSGRLYVQSMSLEIVRRSTGWAVSRVLQFGES